MVSVRHDVDEEWLRLRSARGLDRFDEVWDGVLHVVPPPSGPHQRLGTKLAHVLFDRAEQRGFVLSYETGLFDAEKGDQDYRQPDLSLYRPDNATRRGIDGHAELVVEIRSPDDETYQKFDFYARAQVAELLVIHPDSREFELYRLTDGAYERVAADPEAGVRLTALDVDLATIETDEGPRLRATVGAVVTLI